MLFLERCPDIACRKLCPLLSARVHTIVCLWICLCGGEAVRNLANGCIIFGTVAPSLQRASLKSVGSLHPVPSHPPPSPRSDSGSRAKRGSAGLTDCSQGSSTKTAGPVARARPSTHSTTLHYPQMAGPLTGNHRHWCSASVSGGVGGGFHPPLGSSGQTRRRSSMFMFVQQINS